MAGANDARKRKNLPKRALNPNKKAKHARSWARAQERKAANIAANYAAWKANEEYRSQGLPTPYQERSRAKREAHWARKNSRVV